MAESGELMRISKFLSYVLRHKPQAIGLDLDGEGWAHIDDLIVKATRAGTEMDRDVIGEVVATSDKKRFAISENGQLIRAVQGHSTNHVAIAYSEMTPPQFLYHGTATRFIDSIQQKGLIAGSRHYVHLSADSVTATTVGRRHGRAVILRIAASEMHRQGLKFYQADNAVWLTKFVPPAFILAQEM